MEYICERCGKVHDGTYGSGRFCSSFCAHARKQTEKTKRRISISVHNHPLFKPSFDKKLETYYVVEAEEGKLRFRKKKKYFTGSKELDEKYPEIGNHQSPKWFLKFIPFGFDYSSLYTERVVDEFLKVRDLLYKEYIENELSPSDIYKKYNCGDYIKHSEGLLILFKYLNFPTRGLSEAGANAFRQGKLDNNLTTSTHSIGHERYHITWEEKVVYLRSNLEYDYAKYLDENKIPYGVEALRIPYFDTQKNHMRCAIPDFYLPDTNMIVEIKSNYTLDVQEMVDKSNEYKKLGYGFTLILDNKEVDIHTL